MFFFLVFFFKSTICIAVYSKQSAQLNQCHYAYIVTGGEAGILMSPQQNNMDIIYTLVNIQLKEKESE